MTLYRKTALSLVLVCAWCVAAYAEPERRTTEKTQTTTIQQSAPSEPFTTRYWQRSSEVLGRPIAIQGTTAGKVEDLVVDVNSGRIVYGVHSLNNVPGSSDKLYPVPWPTGHYSTAEKTYTMDVPTERFQTVTSFPATQWPNFNDQQFTTRTFRSYDATPYWETKTTTTSGSGTTTIKERGASLASDTPRSSTSATTYQERWYQQPTTLQRISEIHGRDIRASDGTVVGKVSEVVVDPEGGRVLYATVQSSGDKLIAIPWSALQERDRAYQLSVTTEKMKNAPSFERSRWPDMIEPRYVDEVHRYYSVEPAWTSTTTTTTTQEKREKKDKDDDD